MPRTVSDEEYAHLMGRKQIADFVEPVYNSPQLGSEARALLKKAYPNLQIEGYDLKQELHGEIAKEREERLASERKRAEAEETERFNAVRKQTQNKYKFTDDAMKRLEDLMVERNIGDYEAGAMLMAAKEPRAAEPTSGARHFWEHEKQDGFTEISKDPEKWGFNQLLAAAERDAARSRNSEF
jgi:hypothetical protein